MLEAKNISKRFGRTIALNNVSITMYPGEIRALLGSNGSGKSTLAKVLGGIVDNDDGTILIDDQIVSIKSAHDALKNRISLAYQDNSLVDELTVEQNIFLCQPIVNKFGFIDAKKMRLSALEAIERFKITAAPDDLVSTLDQSNRSLLEVAKAVASNPRYLILDEVTASMNKDQVRHLFQIMFKELDKGVSILFISHRFDEIFDFCTSSTILRNGENQFEGNICSLAQDDIVFHMTGHKKTILDLKGECLVSDGKPVIEVKNLSVGNTVRNVSLSVHPCEIVGVCGLQGQGQEDFLRAVFGSKKYHGGEVFLAGERLHKMSPEKSIKAGLGFISGDRRSEGIFAERSIFENIVLSLNTLRATFNGIKYANRKALAKRKVDDLTIIIGHLNNAASSLSGGNQQKLLIARNLLLDLQALILDDPTKGVDIHARSDIQNMLIDLTKDGLGCIYYSSDYKELIAISDKIIVFYEGQIIKSFDVVNETIEEELVQAMLGIVKNEDNYAFH